MSLICPFVLEDSGSRFPSGANFQISLKVIYAKSSLPPMRTSQGWFNFFKVWFAPGEEDGNAVVDEQLRLERHRDVELRLLDHHPTAPTQVLPV